MHKNFQTAYYSLIQKIIAEGSEVTVRGLDMKEIIPGYFEIENPRDRLLNIDCRSAIKKYIFGELMWYLTGRDDVEFINKYSKMWARLSDDGIHNNSAYGKYIFNEMPIAGYGINNDNFKDTELEFKTQWEFVKEVLTKDPASRQATIHIKPIQMYSTKDTVCTYFLQFFIRNNKLDMIACMRSNDLLFGTTYDVFMFTFLQELMASELGYEVGSYKHFASNMHIYMKDMEKINDILKESPDKKTFDFARIPSDFRSHDLPILVKLEKSYWDNAELDNNLIDSLSDIGRQLLSMLTGVKYEYSTRVNK